MDHDHEGVHKHFVHSEIMFKRKQSYGAKRKQNSELHKQ